jgi:hypothetical protein
MVGVQVTAFLSSRRSSSLVWHPAAASLTPFLFPCTLTHQKSGSQDSQRPIETRQAHTTTSPCTQQQPGTRPVPDPLQLLPTEHPFQPLPTYPTCLGCDPCPIFNTCTLLAKAARSRSRSTGSAGQPFSLFAFLFSRARRLQAERASHMGNSSTPDIVNAQASVSPPRLDGADISTSPNHMSLSSCNP